MAERPELGHGGVRQLDRGVTADQAGEMTGQAWVWVKRRSPDLTQEIPRSHGRSLTRADMQ